MLLRAYFCLEGCTWIVFCIFSTFFTWPCLWGLLSFLSEHFPAMFLYDFFLLQTFLYWFLMPSFGWWFFLLSRFMTCVIFCSISLVQFCVFVIQSSKGRFWSDWLEYFACFLPCVGSQVLHRFFFFTSSTVPCWSIDRFMHSLFVIFLLFTVNFSWLLQLFIISVRSYSRRRLRLQG
jgi:hypothetical protein